MRASAMPRSAGLLLCLLFTLAIGACGSAQLPPPRVSLESLRTEAEKSSDGELVGRWLLGELLLPGGDPKRANEARKRLELLGRTSAPGARGMFAAMSRLVDDEAHGRFKSAAQAALQALSAAHSSDHPDAPLVAWYAMAELGHLRRSVAGLWDVAKPTVLPLLDDPGNIGWRARGDLVEWWSIDGYDPTKQSAKDAEEGGALEAASRALGCVRSARLAGPFGHGASTDSRARFPAERPGPWPLVFEKEPRAMTAPRVVKVERRGCALRPAESVDAGVYYVETFIDAPADRDAIIAVQAALSVFVDDVEVLTRDTRQWGIWPRFGARVRLSPGRHRVLARVAGPDTAIRLLTPAGLPLDVTTSDDPTPPYSLVAPVVLPDPNPLTPFLTAVGVPPQKGAPASSSPVDTGDPISRYLAAYLAHVENQDDVAAVLFAPLTEDRAKATGPALSVLAAFVERDPIYPSGDARDLVKEIRTRAADKDADLWWPQMWLVLDEADKSGVPEAARKMSALVERFAEVPDFSKSLAAMYADLGWRAERTRTLKAAAARFPDDLDVLPDLLALYEDEGDLKKADEIAAHIQKHDPDAEIDLDRALRRRDYKAAIAELKKLGERRKDRRDIALRIADLLVRSGQNSETIEKLERTLAKNPEDAAARLALADARFATGDAQAVRKAIVEAIEKGADPSALRDAAELLDGMTELAPYRIEGKKIIAAFEASGETMQGTAARVLDYAALWVHPDGSARMLEHEIICVQSREAIQELAEQRLRGLALKARTIKRDGRIFEPEIVPGKPTVTMPHLEVGDYIETEMVFTLRGDGRGRAFEGPRWLFREEKVSYWRSEFVVVSPRSRNLDIETGGPVPKPVVTEAGALVVRRWRVDKSPALPEEPGSAPIAEFLPNVRIGWGINLEDTIARLVDATADDTPRDPRLAKRALEIVAFPEGGEPEPSTKAKGDDKDPKGDGDEKAGDEKAGDEKAAKPAKTTPAASKEPPADPAALAAAAAKVSAEEKARRVYRWVVTNVEPARENDPRRAVMGKSGNRTEAFLYLCRLLGIDAAHGLVRDRLAAPPLGPMSEAESFGSLAVRIKTDAGTKWMVVRDKFAPFGYLPSGLRGQPAVVLRAGAPRETTTSTGARDGITSSGTAKLAEDGSATITLSQRYEGQIAIGLRNVLESLPEAQVQETIESRLLPRSLPGALLDTLDIQNLDDLDSPLTLVMKVRMPNFARVRGGSGGRELVLSPPFALHLSGLATLPARETPIYISESMATLSVVDLQVKLPDGAKVTTSLAPWKADDDGRTVRVNDRVDGASLTIARQVDIPAGRVQPEAYAAFQAFAKSADTALHRDIVIALE